MSLQDWSSNLILSYGWAYDGELGHAFKNPTDREGLVSFWQIRSPQPADYHTLSYFYTLDDGERAAMVANPNWVVDDIFYVYNHPVPNGQTLHRLRLPTTNDHLWSVDDAEVARLQTPEGGSWIYEGPACYLPPPPPSPFSTTPIVDPQPAPMTRYRLVQRPAWVRMLSLSL